MEVALKTSKLCGLEYLPPNLLVILLQGLGRKKISPEKRQHVSRNFNLWACDYVPSCLLCFSHPETAACKTELLRFPSSSAIAFHIPSCNNKSYISLPSHIHNWVLFLVFFHLFILSGVIPPLISHSILGTYQPGEVFFQCLIFCLFILLMGFSRQEY